MRNYPDVPKRPVINRYFDVDITDPYQYLEDKTSCETLSIVAAENAYTKGWFAGHPDFSAEQLEQELRRKDAQKTRELTSVSEACGARCGMRSVQGGLHEVVALDEQMRVTDVLLTEAMLDNRMHLFSVTPSPAKAGLYAVLGVIHGHPRCCVIIWDAETHQTLAELDGTFGFAWSLDGKAVLYSDAELDAANSRNINRVRRYDWQTNELTTLYTYPENAVFIQTAPVDGGCFFQVLLTYDDTLVLFWDEVTGSVTRLNNGMGSYMYIGSQAGRYYFVTNHDAPLSHVVSIRTADAAVPDSLQNDFTITLAEKKSLLSAAGVVPDGLLTLHSQNACSVLTLNRFTGDAPEDIPLPDRYGYASGEERLEISDSGHLFINFESFTQHSCVLEYDAHTHALTRFSQGPERDVSGIVVDQCFFPARDGQKILVYLVRQKDLIPTGNTPVLMYGYGGYSVSSNPWPVDLVTGHDIVEWVQKGRIYAHCIIRGGNEYGTRWHEAAMKGSKKNAFQDFIDTARYLVASGWTKPAKIVATGLSNGGLLMTAVTTMAPDAFGIVVASVPHTDMLRFRNDDRGMMYITEYGDPLESEAMFRYMYSYSPYHNIRQGQVYPALYVQTGEMDNNVPPYHGKKFAIRMQAEASEQNPVLLQVLAHGSHNRGVGDEYYQNTAQMQAFVEIQLS